MGAINGHYGLLVAAGGGGGGGGGIGSGVAWSPTDKSANITLASSDYEATKTAGTGAHALARLAAGRFTGKVYWEHKVGPSVTGPVMDGLSMPYDPLTNYAGQGPSSVAYYQNGVVYRAAVAGANIGAFTNNDTLQFAWDVDGGKWWIGKNGVWLASGNPAAGTNPIHSDLPKGLIPAASFYTINDKLTHWSNTFPTYSPPAGFSAYDVAETLPAAGNNWNPADKGAAIQLLYNNWLMSRNSTSAAWDGARSVTSHNSGKYYAEFEDVLGSGTMFGVSKAGATLAWVGNDANGWSLQHLGPGSANIRVWNNAGFSLGATGALTARGQRGKVAVDFATGKIWLGTQNLAGGGWWGGGDPAAGTGPTFTIAAGSTLYLAASVYLQSQIILRCQPGENAMTIPTGFSMWG